MLFTSVKSFCGEMFPTNLYSCLLKDHVLQMLFADM